MDAREDCVKMVSEEAFLDWTLARVKVRGWKVVVVMVTVSPEDLPHPYRGVLT